MDSRGAATAPTPVAPPIEANAVPVEEVVARSEPKRRSKRGLELTEWEIEGQLPEGEVDRKLWDGAAAQGWRVLPKYRGANEKSHWC
tara:strand:+ start:79 stop:339 length:261 start_codon:yes stop_codon:yes gene_type:complete